MAACVAGKSGVWPIQESDNQKKAVALPFFECESSALPVAYWSAKVSPSDLKP